MKNEIDTIQEIFEIVDEIDVTESNTARLQAAIDKIYVITDTFLYENENDTLIP